LLGGRALRVNGQRSFQASSLPLGCFDHLGQQYPGFVIIRVSLQKLAEQAPGMLNIFSLNGNTRLLQGVGHGELRDYILSASSNFSPTSRFCKGNLNEKTMRQKKPTRHFDAIEPTICRDLRAIIKLQSTSRRVDYDTTIFAFPGLKSIKTKHIAAILPANGVIFMALKFILW
jgi:hypothetical protein